MAAVGVALAGCAAPIRNKEDMLLAAGFAYKPADTPQRIANLKALPPHQFVHQMRNGQLVWLYADPTICVCLYAGDHDAFARYKQEVLQKQIADEQQMTARINEDAAITANMDWGLWGGGVWAPYNF
jgi:hypothetical protein